MNGILTILTTGLALSMVLAFLLWVLFRFDLFEILVHAVEKGFKGAMAGFIIASLGFGATWLLGVDLGVGLLDAGLPILLGCAAIGVVIGLIYGLKERFW